MVIRFSTLEQASDGTIKEMNIRTIQRESIAACPHTILVPEHYRDDGSCRCNDPDHKEMREWGYRWRNGQWR